VFFVGGDGLAADGVGRGGGVSSGDRCREDE